MHIRGEKIEEITLDELSNAMPKPVFDKMMQHVKNRMEEQEEPSFRMTMRSKVQFTMPSGLHSVLERPFSEANGRPFLVKRSPLIVC